jgi:inorganic pyrophosphatase/exopolyphosphatase
MKRTIYNKKRKIIITAYNKPDLDGVASAYAYAEFLRHQKKHCTVAFSGKLQSEALFICDFLNIKFEDFDKLPLDKEKIILVDASEIDMISEKIDPKQVIEVIDHRAIHSAHLFPNASIQIEPVGSCATLIAEKFISSGLKPSRESTIFLYCAIVSNTINFKANVTTDRDRKAADFLLSCHKMPEDIIHKMFKFKSKIDDPIALIFPDNLKSTVFGNKNVSIFQIEIIGVKQFIKNNINEINDFLLTVSKDNGFDHVFLTCIDLEEGENTFVATNPATAKMLSDILGIKFSDNVAQYDKIIMRKELMPLVKEYLEDREK